MICRWIAFRVKSGFRFCGFAASLRESNHRLRLFRQSVLVFHADRPLFLY